MSKFTPEDREIMNDRIGQLGIQVDVLLTEMRSYKDHITAVSILVEELGQKIDEITRQIKI